MKLIYDIKDKPPVKQNLMFALQEMIAIMAATLLVPILMTQYGLPSDPAAALFGAGLGTLVYIFFTKRKSPVFLGSSFAFLGAYSTTIAAGYGYLGIIVGVGIAAAVYVIFALIIKAVGSNWVNTLLPAAIAGPIVSLIGLSLSSTATSWMSTNGGSEYSLITIAIGLITFFAIVWASVKGNKTMQLFPFVVGIAIGYVVALVVTLIGNATGNEALQVLNFSVFTDAFIPFRLTSIIDYPKVFLIRAMETQGQYEAIDLAAFINLLLVFAPLSIVLLCEHIGDHKNVSNIINKDLITDPGLDKTLLGDGVGSFVGTVFGCCANTTYGESVACVAITGNASVSTLFYTAIGCILLSFFTPFITLINSIPKCVMGGACVALYGFIAASGLQLLSKVDLSDNRNLYPVAAIFVCGIGGLVLDFGYNPATDGALISITSLAVAMIVGIITRKICGPGKEKE